MLYARNTEKAWIYAGVPTLVGKAAAGRKPCIDGSPAGVVATGLTRSHIE